MPRTLMVVMALGGLLGTAATAQAQSYSAPAGRDPATAPGGTEGIAGPRNESEAIRSGDAVVVSPRGDGIPVQEPPAPQPGGPAAPLGRY
ncbi:MULTISPECIES: hypothetical protein [unclassified Methylobacterium]|jgi:hypothetical protein|uniref:hypothetical protein n=1 Tax=unclassified Methylobacterium TaxID=2615210 RepID=UPI001352447F|nr:hypothetical protein [Methylobacterium sp. 2A]MWV25002.1 hypothetical protein [Methylobacterium sp. 2A]